MRSRLIIFMAALGLLAACSSGSKQPLVKTIWAQIKAQREASKAPPAQKATPTRAQIEELDSVMIQINLEGDAVWPILVGASQNGQYVTYSSRLRQSVTLRESQVVGTRGFGTDLVLASSSDNDPLKNLTPPSQWPQAVTREYRFGGRAPDGRVERYDCVLQKGGAATIVLAGTSFDVVGFAETCTGADGQFQNLYAADAKTGRVWQSQQYIGRNMGKLTLEVLEALG